MNKDLIIDYTPLGMYEFRYEGGGQLPKELSGMYTTHREAVLAKARYLNINKRSVSRDRAKRAQTE